MTLDAEGYELRSTQGWTKGVPASKRAFAGSV